MENSIVIALPNAEHARQVRGLLMRYGFEVGGVSTTGAGALLAMSGLFGGVLICAYHLKDMFYRDILEQMPEEFEMILVATPAVLAQAPSGLVCLELPLKGRDLVETLRMVLRAREKKAKKKPKPPQPRPEEDQRQIERAKELLMERNHMSEEEAHRYLQKISMETGNSLVETAEMIQMLL